MRLQTSILCLLGTAAFSARAVKIVGGKGFDRFITIWLENQDFDKVAVNEHAAELKSEGILLTRFFALTHPSQPNYIASIGGDYFGLDHDDDVRVPENVSTVVDLLDVKGITWRGYFEDIPGPGYMAHSSDGSTGNGGWDYVRKHNPFVSFDSITSNGSRLLNIQGFDEFQRDFAAKAVPQFCFMSPNMMHDGHNTTLDVATSWAHTFLKPVLDGGAFDEKTLIMLTYDESEDYKKPNHIVTLLLGSAIPAALRGSVDDTYYDHYSILATVEHNWGLPNLGRYDAGANVFGFLASSPPAYHNKEPAGAASVDNSVSYPGALNRAAGKQAPLPPPNLKLKGASGLPVLESVARQWRDEADAPTPYDGSGSPRDGSRNLPVYKPPAPNAR